jgi:hypothetical protein
VWSLKTTKDLSECVNIRQSTQWLKGQTANDLHRKQNIGNTNPTLNLGWNSGAPVGLTVSAPLMIPVLLFLSQNLWRVLNEEMTGSWLPQTKHIRGQLNCFNHIQYISSFCWDNFNFVHSPIPVQSFHISDSLLVNIFTSWI